MAKVIIKSVLNNRGYYVESKTINTLVGEVLETKRVDLRISPSAGYVLNYEEFTTGALPEHVSSLVFNQSGNNVIATVNLQDFIVKEEMVNIILPISGPARVPGGEVTISTSDVTTSGIVAGGFTGTRTFKGNSGKTISLFKKTFSVTRGYEFISTPTSTIVGNNTRYTVARQKIGDSYVFDVFYEFPTNLVSSKTTSSIRFNASARKIKEKVTDIKLATKKEDYQIYSIDTGPEVSNKGGIKKIVVRGVPGTPFEIMVQDTSKNIYNFDIIKLFDLCVTKECRHPGSNRGPSDLQSDALPTEL